MFTQMEYGSGSDLHLGHNTATGLQDIIAIHSTALCPANNQLLTSEGGYALDRRQILYVPDYVINSGGIIFMALTHANEDQQTIHHKVANIGHTLTQLFRASQTSAIPPFALANQQAESISSAAASNSRSDKRIVS